ncbi:MAG TPA: hypothetical protein VIO36_05235 [Anaerolineaceae bacterium]
MPPVPENTQLEPEKKTPYRQRKDLMALWAGVLFSLGFTLIIWLGGRWLADVPHLADQGAGWYFWRLPEPRLWAQITAWGFYLLHQLSLWVIIYLAQKTIRRYTTGLHRLNVIALAVNAGFIVLHLLQTYIWYDGLAQDMHVFTSFGSVAIMLIWILLMENNRRGMFFSRPLPIRDEIIRFARKYHAYYFAWAIVYTFWFHPAESTPGHLAGFFYIFLLLLQSSLFFTRIHNNRYWTTILEVTVLLHAVLVAYIQGEGLWPMFAFGFGGIFVITQMHGLGLMRWPRFWILATYIVLAGAVYTYRGLGQINEIIRIPAIDYLGVVVLALLFGAGLWIARLVRGKPAA